MSTITVAVDLRSMFGPVRNQGARPTCLAFAASDTHAALRDGWVPLSCEYAFFHAQRRAGRLPNQGALLSATLETLREDGQPAEVSWPYLAKLPANVTTWVPPATIGELFARDGMTTTAAVSAVIKELDCGRPVLLLLRLSAAFFAPRRDGVVDPAPGEVPEQDRRHAVIAVGHGVVEGQTAILVRNSWGDRWADGGYGWLTNAFLGPRLTYSFPVHSLTLEVQDGSTFNRFQNQAEVSLNRDASLGISEYAPGAEVVANGRIWESAGLASYPKAFMPTRWYAACPECFHVDVADAHQDLPDGCSNCGYAEPTRRRRMFLEPKGFVTSVADSKGKDPGTSRRRVKPADEARLIAAPRPESFQETDLPFLSTALLLARGSEDNDLRGSLFVTNRGTYGEGYYRCLFCNYCQPASKQKKTKDAAKKGPKSGDAATRKFVHKDPSTGSTCKSEVMPKMGVDFAHMFNTDVRLLRFLAPLPEASEDVSGERRFQEHVARTVAEACRLAASDMLHLYAGELRSTYRLYANAGCIAEVVLYDGVPGGAGYSARLGTPQFSFRELMAGALRRLDCPQDCESACRACLCDYGNQRHWDSFRRKETLTWLKALLDARPTADGSGNYVPWPKPSLSGLSERLAPSSSIFIIATSLSGAAGYRETELNQLLTWLQSGKEMELYIVNKLIRHPSDYQTLMLYRHLYPWMQAGKLRIHELAELDGRIAGQIPRVFAGIEDGSLLVRQAFPVQALLDGLVSSPAELGAMDAGTRELLKTSLASAVPYAPEHFAEGQKMGMWEFAVGAPRPLDDVFAAIKGLHVKSLVVRDPYCGTERNRQRLKQLLTFLKGHLSEMERADVYCSEVKERQRDGTDYVANRLEIAYQIERVLDESGVLKGEAFVKELGRNRTFHDRELTFDAVDQSGCGTTHRYFLTGGIDYLLDERSDTRVFHAVVTN